jgi:predicted nucleic acid-binding protein
VLAYWVKSRHGHELWTTSITLAEIYYGIERLPSGRRKDHIEAAASRAIEALAGRVLPFDTEAARQYALLAAGRDRAGLPIAALDAQIAAICAVHGASVATRNVKDFLGTGIEVIDPWLAS